jgi:hypothetical protein
MTKRLRQLAVVCLAAWAPLAGQTPPPGVWHGSGTTERVSDLRWITILVRYDSEFSFVTDAAGAATGTATVRYSMRLDDAQLRGLLSQANAAANQPMNMVPGIGGLLGFGARMQDLQGMSASFDEGTAVRESQVRGYVRDGVVHLTWAEPPKPLSYTSYRVYPARKETIQTHTAPAYSPWTVEATLTSLQAGHWEAAVPAANAVVRGQQTTTTTTWTVRRDP